MDAISQDVDSINTSHKGRAYWKEKKIEQKEKFNDFLDWQKQFLNVSDSRFSIMFSIGYGLPVINQKVESLYPFLGTSVKYEDGQGNIKETGIYTTDGKGFRAMVRGRLMFNPFAGIELGIAAEWYDEILNGSIHTPTYRSSITSQSYAVTISPQLVMSSPNLRNFYVYGRIGLYTPIWGGSRSKVHVVDYQGALIREFVNSDMQELIDFAGLLLNLEKFFDLLGYKATLDADVKVDFYKTLSVIGFQTAVGFRYQFSKKWGVAVEYFHGGYAPFLKKSRVEKIRISADLLGREILSLNEDGGILSLIRGQEIEIDPELLTSTLDVNYYRSLDQDSNNASVNPNGVDPTRPQEELTDKRLAYSNGFFVGIQYNLPCKQERGKDKKR